MVSSQYTYKTYAQSGFIIGVSIRFLNECKIIFINSIKLDFNSAFKIDYISNIYIYFSLLTFNLIFF